jgi:hypothetical protein
MRRHPATSSPDTCHVGVRPVARAAASPAPAPPASGRSTWPDSGRNRPSPTGHAAPRPPPPPTDHPATTPPAPCRPSPTPPPDREWPRPATAAPLDPPHTGRRRSGGGLSAPAGGPVYSNMCLTVCRPRHKTNRTATDVDKSRGGPPSSTEQDSVLPALPDRATIDCSKPPPPAEATRRPRRRQTTRGGGRPSDRHNYTASARRDVNSAATPKAPLADPPAARHPR